MEHEINFIFAIVSITQDVLKFLVFGVLWQTSN